MLVILIMTIMFIIHFYQADKIFLPSNAVGLLLQLLGLAREPLVEQVVDVGAHQDEREHAQNQ